MYASDTGPVLHAPVSVREWVCVSVSECVCVGEWEWSDEQYVQI